MQKAIRMRAFANIFILMCTFQASAHAEALHTPNFVKLTLDGETANVLYPNGWHVKSIKKDTWIISMDKPANDTYETGMRIEITPGIKQASGESPEEFARKLIFEKLGAENAHVGCAERKSSGFTNTCIETTEPTGRPLRNSKFLYSVSWSNERDILITTTFHTPEGTWESMKATAKVMSNLLFE